MDDWDLRRSAEDDALVGHRLAALRRDPFHGEHWRALGRDLGRAARRQRIDAALRRAPDDPALLLLRARDLLERGAPAEAAALASDPRVLDSRFARRALDWSARAWRRAGEETRAVETWLYQAPSWWPLIAWILKEAEGRSPVEP